MSEAADSFITVLPEPEIIQKTLEERHGKILQQKFSRAHVAICGLGGLGSHIAISLARAGIGHLHVIDFDSVDLSNLHRQQYFISQIGLPKTTALKQILQQVNPYIQIQADTLRITLQNFAGLLQSDKIICEAFDNPEAKAMLVNGILEKFPDKYLVAASGMAGLGAADEIHTRKITSHFYVCGDGFSESSHEQGNGMLVSSRVMLCAAHQAHEILRLTAELDI